MINLLCSCYSLETVRERIAHFINLTELTTVKIYRNNRGFLSFSNTVMDQTDVSYKGRSHGAPHDMEPINRGIGLLVAKTLRRTIWRRLI